MDGNGWRHGRRRLDAPWWRDPHRVDGYQADGLAWPMETSRYAYLAPFGGFSQELDSGRVGIHKQALYENTELQPGDQVTVSVFEDNRPVPLLVQPTFEVVPLDFETPDAFLQSTDGQAVLSVDDTDTDHLVIERPASGLRVVLNGVIACQLRGNGA